MRLISLGLLWALSMLTGFAADPATFKVGSLNFTRPADWTWIEVASAMRKAQLEVPSTTGKAEVIFFEFPSGQGGDAQANINRWLGQFQEGKDKIGAQIDKKSAGSRTVTYVQAEGTYLSGMPGGPKTPMPKYALQGAIIESKDGNIFVRLTGPSPVVKDARAAFKKMIDSGL